MKIDVQLGRSSSTNGCCMYSMQYLAHLQDAPETETENNQINCFRSFVFSIKFQVKGHKGFNFSLLFWKDLDSVVFRKGWIYFQIRISRCKMKSIPNTTLVLAAYLQLQRYCEGNYGERKGRVKILWHFPSPRSMILRRVNLPTVSYCTESIFPQYHTAQSQSPHIINCTESISQQYCIAGSHMTFLDPI